MEPKMAGASRPRGAFGTLVRKSPSRLGGARSGVLGGRNLCHEGLEEGPTAQATVLAAMWVGSSILGVIASSLPQGARVDRPGELALALVGLATGLSLFALRNRVPSWAIHGLMVGGVACVSAAIYLAGGSREAVAAGYLYLWIVSFAGYFFRPVVAGAHFAMVSAGFLSVLALGALGAEPGPIAVMVLGSAAGSAVVLNQLAKRLRAAAVTDQLTGLPNRNVLRALFAHEAARANRSGETLALAVVDLDGLKAVNDSAGHQAGDRLIAATSRRWLEALRDVDTLIRYGGDEFVIIMPGCEPEDAGRACDRMRLVGEAPCSVGVTSWLPGETLDALLARADTALYEAKRSGRGRTVVSSSRATPGVSPASGAVRREAGRLVHPREAKLG